VFFIFSQQVVFSQPAEFFKHPTIMASFMSPSAKANVMHLSTQMKKCWEKEINWALYPEKVKKVRKT